MNKIIFILFFFIFVPTKADELNQDIRPYISIVTPENVLDWNFKREPNHPRNKFDYAVVVPNHPLGYHEHYCMDLEVAKKSAIEWATDYGRASVEDRNLDTVFAVR